MPNFKQMPHNDLADYAAELHRLVVVIAAREKLVEEELSFTACMTERQRYIVKEALS